MPNPYFLSVEGLQKIARSYHSNLEFNEELQQWEVTHKNRDPLYFTQAELDETPAIVFIAMVDCNTKELNKETLQ